MLDKINYSNNIMLPLRTQRPTAPSYVCNPPTPQIPFLDACLAINLVLLSPAAFIYPPPSPDATFCSDALCYTTILYLNNRPLWMRVLHHNEKAAPGRSQYCSLIRPIR